MEPEGTVLKTANTAPEYGLILARGDLKQRRYRLTAVGAELTKWRVDQHETGKQGLQHHAAPALARGRLRRLFHRHIVFACDMLRINSCSPP